MLGPQMEIQLIAVVVAVACALPGVFLVLRQMSMMSDAITHTILLGIVLAFFMVHDLSSPLLIVGAALVGVATVFLTETLSRTRLLAEDASIGIVFPLLFSIAILLITRYAGSVHLDTDSVLLGELAFAPFDRMVIARRDIGAKSLYTIGALLLLSVVFIVVFFKELKLATFDPVLAAAMGFAPVIIHYGLMTLVSLTAVGAFEAVGSVLVLAFMIGPPATAYLLTDDLKWMIILSAFIGAANGLLGYQAAMHFDVSIAGSMAVVTGLVFALVFLCAPRRGLVTALWRRRQQRLDFRAMSMLFHIHNHETDQNVQAETGVDTLHGHLGWSRELTKKVLDRLVHQRFIYIQKGVAKLTTKGKRQSFEYQSRFALNVIHTPDMRGLGGVGE